MSSDIHNDNFGDSAGNKSSFVKYNSSDHVFDGAGENIKYHSDSESVSSKDSKARYINPAIYIEKVESTHSVTSLHGDHCDHCSIDDITPHPHSSYRSNSTPFLTGRISNSSSSSVKRKSCRLVGVELNVYDDELDETTPRNERPYQEDGADTFRLSVVSVSTTTTAKMERERQEQKKQEAFKQWLARKEQEKREKAHLEKQKHQTVQAKNEAQRQETFQRWLENKRSQGERRRAEEIMRQYRKAEQIERERKKRLADKEEKITDWARKKEEELKAMKTREERRVARAAMEEERRRMNGERAYRDWLRTSKNKSLPVPLNQGELSMRGSVSQMYVNPIPWQSPT